ncbi:MAG: CpsD/CapB family tyrosine-protein kinase [Acholeplasmataceae bacterium]
MFKKPRKESYEYIEVELNPNSPVSNAIEKFVINLELVNIDKLYKVIQVTSTLPTEGKTTIVGNLAYVLAQKGYRTLIIDLDLRKPKINRIFNHANVSGINRYLLEKVDEEELIVKTDKGIDFIPTGPQRGSVTSVLESKKLSDLIESLKEKYDYIILDTPPMQVNADALITSKLADGLLYILGNNIVKKSLIKESIDTLKRRNINILGIVLTQVKIPKREHYYYYND